MRGQKVSGSALLPEALRAHLPLGSSAAMREPLKAVMAGRADFPLGQLYEAARTAGWSALELEKLTTYGEFFSGQAAQGYARVMEKDLAATDYPLFMTACLHCYLYDRFAEGYALLRRFRPHEAAHIDWGEFYAYAGYIAFAGGGTVEEACTYFDQALAQNLFSALLVINAYPIYFEAGRLREADLLRRRLFTDYADDPEAIYAAACVELARDFYPEGFRLAEARYRMPEVARSMNPSLLDKPRWHGEPLAGRRLLVHGEQGLGDVVMMARYLPLLLAQGAQVVLDCRPQAVSLLAHNFPGCEIVGSDLRTPLPVAFDLWTGIMSLPWHFDTTAQTAPATAGYLTVPPEAAAYWRRRVAELSRGKLRIGLAWSGNPAHRADKRRSIAFDLVASHLRAWPAIDFFALQTSVPPERPRNLIDVHEELVTLADTAALIEQMDLVITVDTSPVHLAGALGKETWLLLPHRYEWRWSLEGESNNWYDAVRVLRQKTHGDWAGLLAEAFGARLRAFLERSA